MSVEGNYQSTRGELSEAEKAKIREIIADLSKEVQE